MDSVAVTVPLRAPMKKMKKRKELDALAPSHVISRRTSGKRSSQELLTDSSDERSEYWNVSIRGNRKARARRTRSCPGLVRACTAFFGCASILATASLIWLFIDVRQQLTSLRTEVDQAIAGSEGVPDALQKCHSLSKDLQNNQTILFNQLADVKAQITNFTIQLSGIQQELHQVQKLLNAAPELTSVPDSVKNVLTSVASFGSKIKDLAVTVSNLKDREAKLQEDQQILQFNITDTKNTLTELSKISQKPETSTNEFRLKTEELNHTISQLQSSLMKINDTLTSSFQWVSDNQGKDHQMLNSLQDKTQNASMKVLSLETECAKVSEQRIINASVVKLTDDISKARALNVNLTGRVQQLEQSYSNLKNSTDTIINTVLSGKSQKEDVSSQYTNKENHVTTMVTSINGTVV